MLKKLYKRLVSMTSSPKNSSNGGMKMNVRAQKADYEKISCDVLIVGMFEKEKNPFTKHLDKKLNNEISVAIRKEHFNGEFGEAKAFSTLGKMPARRVLIMGLGKKKDYSLEQLRRASATAIKAGRNGGAKRIVTTLHTFPVKEKSGVKERAQACSEGTILGAYQFNRFKTEEKKKIKNVDEFVLVDKQALSDVAKGVKKAQILSAAAMHVRDLVNLPANYATPTFLANEASKLKKLGVKVKVFGRKDLKKMGFNSHLAVAAGSVQEPKFVVMEYGKGKKTYAFVGKGITFDSGGLDLKPSKYMEDMKSDMGGAATTIGIMEAVARLKLPVHLVCAFAATENMPGPASYKPGDIITAYNKKTIEMLNSDAEGRMVLADALPYIEKKYKPEIMIDLATLTGSVVVALGYWATGLMSTDDELCNELVEAGEQTYERVWRLPLWEEYRDTMKSDIADVRNIGKSYDAGTITAAVFLSHFVDKVRWAHLDIAGTAFFSEPKHYFSRGGTGNGVRLLVKWLEGKAR